MSIERRKREREKDGESGSWIPSRHSPLPPTSCLALFQKVPSTWMSSISRSSYAIIYRNIPSLPLVSTFFPLFLFIFFSHFLSVCLSLSTFRHCRYVDCTVHLSRQTGIVQLVNKENRITWIHLDWLTHLPNKGTQPLDLICPIYIDM